MKPRRIARGGQENDGLSSCAAFEQVGSAGAGHLRTTESPVCGTMFALKFNGSCRTLLLSAAGIVGASCGPHRASGDGLRTDPIHPAASSVAKANEDVAAHVTVLSRQSKSEPRARRAPPRRAPADDGACMAAFASKALDPLGDKHLPPREPVRRRRRRRIGWRLSPLRRFDGAPSAED